MKNPIYVILFALAMMPSSMALGQPDHKIVYRDKDCGVFSVHAATDIGPFADYFRQGFSQTIRLFNPSKHIDRHLNLAQHRSPNPRLRGRYSLDGMASAWVCLQSTFGQTYLFLAMYCANEGARTCRTGMGAPDSEWMLLYDDAGKLLISEPPAISRMDEGRFRSLGLAPALERSIDLPAEASIF